MPSTPSSPAQYVRRGLLKISDATVLEAVDALDLRANARISAVVGMPLRSLQQRRDVTSFATSAPIAAVKALLELLAMDPLEKVIEALGDHAETPSYDQLAAAVDQLLASGTTNDDIVALLAFAISEDFPAGPHCRRLFEERPEFSLPELLEAATNSSLIAPKVVDVEVREQRKARREEEKKKRAKAPVRSVRPAKSKAEKKAPMPTPRPTPAGAASLRERRRGVLTPVELERFSAEHLLVGTVVLIEVPFDSVDPVVPEQKAKARPALVVAASDTGVLVRGIYSNPATTRVLFQPWRRLGFDHVSYIDGERISVVLDGLDGIVRLGHLGDEEWNGLV
jgi:hypothetical protein